MKNLFLFLAICSAASVSTPAHSCSYAFHSRSEIAEEIASHGTVILGTVVRRVDARRHQPLIVRAEKVYIGDNIKTYVIGSFPIEYELLLNPKFPHTSCDSAAYDPPLGDSRIFVLAPNGAADGTWRISLFGGDLINADARPILRDAAARAGRLRSPLPEWP